MQGVFGTQYNRKGVLQPLRATSQLIGGRNEDSEAISELPRMRGNLLSKNVAISSAEVEGHLLGLN
jgi:hypothetical protein